MGNFATYQDEEIFNKSKNLTILDWQQMRDEEYWKKYDALVKFKYPLLNHRLNTIKEYLSNK